MKDQYRKKPVTATTTAKATAATPAIAASAVERPLFALPASVWAAIDQNRRNTGMSAAQYIASLVLKAAK